MEKILADDAVQSLIEEVSAYIFRRFALQLARGVVWARLLLAISSLVALAGAGLLVCAAAEGLLFVGSLGLRAAGAAVYAAAAGGGGAAVTHAVASLRREEYKTYRATVSLLLNEVRSGPGAAGAAEAEGGGGGGGGDAGAEVGSRILHLETQLLTRVKSQGPEVWGQLQRPETLGHAETVFSARGVYPRLATTSKVLALRRALLGHAPCLGSELPVPCPALEGGVGGHRHGCSRRQAPSRRRWAARGGALFWGSPASVGGLRDGGDWVSALLRSEGGAASLPHMTCTDFPASPVSRPAGLMTVSGARGPGGGVSARAKGGSHGLRDLTSPGATGSPSAHSRPDYRQSPNPHRCAGGRDIPLCLCVFSACQGGPVGGFRAQGQGTVAHLLPQAAVPMLAGGGGGGLCVPGAPGPSGGAGEPYTEAAAGVCGSGDLRLPPAHD